MSAELAELLRSSGRLEAAIKHHGQELERIDRRLKEDTAAHRSAISAIEARLPAPRKGEVVFWGLTWSAVQVYFPLALVTVLLTAATVVSGVLWSEVKTLHEMRHESDRRIQALEIFASAGGRATDEDIRGLVKLMLPFFRCVNLRFQERTAGLDLGVDLPTPDDVTGTSIRECASELPGKLRLIESWDVKRP